MKKLVILCLFFSFGKILSGQQRKLSFSFGCNFIPSSAVNQLEMWQAESFDTATISKELKLASSIGMNVIRVYLHDLVYRNDSTAFLKRIDVFLSIANRYRIKTVFVFFDSCWDPFPFAGQQAEAVPARHNSRWVQSPGYITLKDSRKHSMLENYVKSVVTKFSNDDRVFAWDVWNEPDFTNDENNYGKEDLPNKAAFVLPVLKKAFAWVRSAHPRQPVTSGLWKLYSNWNVNYVLDSIENVQIQNSDIISFHYYGNATELEKRIVWLKRFNKPVICTEYLARGSGSTFETCLPVFIRHNVAAFNWGLVSGKTQTIYPWDSWQKAYASEPLLWHHDIFWRDGKPFNYEEVKFIRTITNSISQK